ncbi:MAG: DUF402 domain-containing protein [Anaerolineales bacterium]
MTKNYLQEVVRVVKCNLTGQETWSYQGNLIKRSRDIVLLEAFFNRADLPFHNIVLRQGDRFLEAYFSKRWYNIFEIYDVTDGHLKGWYCNVTKPAIFQEDKISYVDLALDLLVYPDGERLLLDEEEFDALPLDNQTRTKARAALGELQMIFDSVEIFRLESWLDRQKNP